MTGFGKASKLFESKNASKKISVEIKSLNSKQLDLNIKLPTVYKEKESDLRVIISEKILRGKAECAVFIENEHELFQNKLNETVVKNYLNTIQQLAAGSGIEIENPLQIVMQFPDVFQSEKVEINEEEWLFIKQLCDDAFIKFDEFRMQEGNKMSSELQSRINYIYQYLNQVQTFEIERIKAIKTRIHINLKEVVGEENVDKNRFEQEVIYYLEKLDITEEKVRLKAHCDYFLETLHSLENEGRKLQFIAQEIGREINTLGSKANDASIQKLVVQMKDELEKIKEQLSNIL